MKNILLFPSDYFNGDKVDSDLELEYKAATDTGLFEIVLFRYEDWFEYKKLVLNKKIETKARGIYRGWMMKPENYEDFYANLLEHNIELVTRPDAYKLMHVFPNVYPLIKSDTPLMLTFPLHRQINVEQVHSVMKKFMVKDFVKSVKGTDFPKYFDDSITQSEFDQSMELFYKYRGSLLTGGICIKEFVNLKTYGDKVNEFRVFFINHTIASVSRNSGQAFYTTEPPKELLQKYADLPSPFYTIDFAELEDEKWVILETGDGGVSGLSDNQNAFEFYRRLCFLM